MFILEAQITDTKSCKHLTRKENYRPISLQYRCKNPQQSSGKLIQGHIENNMYHGQLGFISAMESHFNIWKPINVVHSTNRINVSDPMIISIDSENIL